KVVLPAENSGKISASRHALTASRYHSSNPGPPPHELLTTSGAISTRPPGARIHTAPASKTSSVVLHDSLNTLTVIHWSPGATPTWLDQSDSLPTIVPVT